MRLTVIKEDMWGICDQEVIEEYAEVNTIIHIDKNLAPRTQRNLTIHAVIETYCPSWPHDKIEELEELIIDGIDQVEGK